MHVAIGSNLLDNQPEAAGSIDDIANSSDTSKQRAQDKERLFKLPPIRYDVCNQTQCIRRNVLDFFKEPANLWSVNPERCCSYHNPNLRLGNLDDGRYYLYNEQGYSFGKAQKAIYADIQTWITQQLTQLPSRYIFTPTPAWFLGDSVCKN